MAAIGSSRSRRTTASSGGPTAPRSRRQHLEGRLGQVRRRRCRLHDGRHPSEGRLGIILRRVHLDAEVVLARGGLSVGRRHDRQGLQVVEHRVDVGGRQLGDHGATRDGESGLSRSSSLGPAGPAAALDSLVGSRVNPTTAASTTTPATMAPIRWALDRPVAAAPAFFVPETGCSPLTWILLVSGATGRAPNGTPVHLQATWGDGDQSAAVAPRRLVVALSAPLEVSCPHVASYPPRKPPTCCDWSARSPPTSSCPWSRRPRRRRRSRARCSGCSARPGSWVSPTPRSTAGAGSPTRSTSRSSRRSRPSGRRWVSESRSTPCPASGWSRPAPRSSVGRGCPTCWPATCWAPTASPRPTPAPTPPRCAPPHGDRQGVTVTSTSSTAPRPGPPTAARPTSTR